MITDINPYKKDTLESARWKKSKLAVLNDERSRLEVGAAGAAEASVKLIYSLGPIEQMVAGEALGAAHARHNARLRAIAAEAKAYELTPREVELDRRETTREQLEFARDLLNHSWKFAIGCIFAGGMCYGAAVHDRDGILNPAITNPVTAASTSFSNVYNFTQSCVPDNPGWHVAAAVVGAPVGGLVAVGAFIGNGGNTLLRGAWDLTHGQTAENTGMNNKNIAPVKTVMIRPGYEKSI